MGAIHIYNINKQTKNMRMNIWMNKLIDKDIKEKANKNVKIQIKG